MADDSSLPPGMSWRRPTAHDARGIFEFVAAYTTAIVGTADVTAEDIADQLAEAGFDLAQDAWLVEHAGRLLGWARVASADGLRAEVAADDDAVADWLWARVVERSTTLAAASGPRQLHLDTAVYRGDEAGQNRVRGLGFALATTFHRMRIDYDQPVDEPRMPHGVVVEVGPGDDDFRRTVHALHQAAFAHHFGFTPQPAAAWLAGVEASSHHDWSQTRVACVEGERVAYLMGSNQFAHENLGYVWRVGVLPEHRRKGLATLLMRQAFARDWQHGRDATVLHVDTANPTPALGLYRELGMREVLAIDIWRLDVS